MERRETDDILTALGDARRIGRRAALATVVRVHGSAYRREGARMLIRDDGALTCMLSGGCLEPEVAEVGRRVIATGVPELRHYDLAEDVVWGLGLGCGGAVDVLIEPVDEGRLLPAWIEVLAAAQTAVLATRLPDGSARMLVRAEGAVAGTLADGELDARVREAAGAILADRFPRAETLRLTTASGARDVFFDVSAPAPELVVFGAGHDAIPVVEQAVAIGWTVTVVDGRPAFTVAERFPDARLVLAPSSERAAHAAVLGPRSYALVMNHHLERDRAALACALASPAPWIGVLGPRARFGKLLDGLRDAGVTLDPARLACVRNPVGLDIGAESAEEVALAIVAALVAERRGFKGGLLDGVAGRIHDPAAR